MSYLGNQPNSAAFLTDQFSGNGSTTAWTLSTAPAGTTSILVSVSGILQDPSTYSVVGTTLTLGGAAPIGTGNISVRYLGIPAAGVVTTAYRTVTEFTATAGQTTFTPPSYSVGFIAVYLNGARLGAADFTASNGTTIVLATGASVDDLVVTESFYISSVANAIPNIPGSVVESNIGSGAVTPTKLSTGAPSWDTNGVVTLGGTTIPDSSKATVNGAKVYAGGIPQQQLNIYDSTTLATGTGGAISFSANYVGSSPTTMASIEGVRENSTSGNYAGNLVFKTRVNGGNNTEAMRINSSGYITTQLQPAFRVRFNGSASFTNGSPILFDTIDYNTGGCYSTSTGRFTAPVTGKYIFYAQLLGNNSAQRGYFFISKNGDSSTELSGTVEFYNSVNGLAILDLVAGDYVMCYPQVSVWYTSPSNQDFFTGYLLG